MESNVSCSCGAARYMASGTPLMRTICHCSICKRYNQSDFADVTVFYRSDVEAEDDSSVAYVSHKNPPIVLRGHCTACGLPAVEKVNMPLMPKLTIVPTQNLTDHSDLPAPGLHIFYEDRVCDVNDNAPKYSGYLRSQLAFGTELIRGMMRRRG